MFRTLLPLVFMALVSSPVFAQWANVPPPSSNTKWEAGPVGTGTPAARLQAGFVRNLGEPRAGAVANLHAGLAEVPFQPWAKAI